jgi:hypothetical protein
MRKSGISQKDAKIAKKLIESLCALGGFALPEAATRRQA